MITFCPLTDVNAIAQLLDNKRLNAQRTEAGAILKWLRTPKRYARFQTAGFCTMWAHNMEALAVYYNAMLREWLARGFNVVVGKFEGCVLGREDEVVFPGWWGNSLLHSNHRTALLTKYPEHYSKYGWSEEGAADGNYNYIWPEWSASSQEWYLRPPRSGHTKPKSSKSGSISSPRKRKKAVARRSVATHRDQNSIVRSSSSVWGHPLKSSPSFTSLDLDSDEDFEDAGQVRRSSAVRSMDASFMDSFTYSGD